MIPKECKRLAEVDFPIAEVSLQSVREKNRREGHPSSLHLWWARRPLASSRAILMALLLPDPCDRYCPPEFKRRASKILLSMESHPRGWDRACKSDEGLRRIMFEFIADYSNWDNAADPKYIDVGSLLIRAAHGGDTPLVVDPFSGGGSIPLEALRLGCDAFASDLNPVACLIQRLMLRDVPRSDISISRQLSDAVHQIKTHSERNLAHLYPNDPDGTTPINYLWARTVRCESPSCGAEIPLVRSFWLCNKPKRKVALRYEIIRSKNRVPQIEFEVFEPDSSRDVPLGTVSKAKATCICCSAVLPPDRVRGQITAQKGGADVIFDNNGCRIGGAQMTAVVTLKPNKKGRHYRTPDEKDYTAVFNAQRYLNKLINDWERKEEVDLSPVPDEPLPPVGTLGFRVQRYGMLKWGDLFTARQKIALVELSRVMSKLNPDSHELLKSLIGLLLGKMADGNCSLARWESGSENQVNLFARQAIPIVWDFCESTPKSNARGVFLSSLTSACKVINNLQVGGSCQVQQADASDHPLPDESAEIWFTDPPYYDAIPYSDLSDFFLVWLKRSLPDLPLLQDPFDINNQLSPKRGEIVQDETKQVKGRSKDRKWFEDRMSMAFAEGKRVLKQDGIGSVVFAHKTTEGWEALLSGIIHGGWTITGSWPIATESPSRLRARESAALATSIHLICRPRPDDASVGDWADVLRELPQRVRSWMDRLEGEGIRGADLVFACIGPALEIYSRYLAVETADGRNINLPEYLEKVWEVVGRTALEQILRTSQPHSSESFSGELEEDARLTALFLWTLQNSKTSVDNADIENAHSTKKLSGFSLPYDVVRRFSQPMGIDLDAWNSSIIVQQKGVVRLLPVTERIKDLFGTEGAVSAAEWIEDETRSVIQSELFAEPNTQLERSKSRRKKRNMGSDSEFEAKAATVLDRVHVAMLLHAGGQASALRKWITFEQRSGPEFLRLANALSALYPVGSQEKRLLDAMLLAVPR